MKILFLLAITMWFSYASSYECSAGEFLYYTSSSYTGLTTDYGCVGCFTGYYCPGDDNKYICPVGYTTKSMGCVSSSDCVKMSCFGGDNEVQLQDGSYSKLIDLKEGDMVSSWDKSTGNSNFSSIGFFALKEYINITLVELCFTSGSCVSITQHHAVQLFNDAFIWAEDVSVGDILVNNDVVETVQFIQSTSLVAPILLDSFLLNVGKGNGVPIPIFGDLSKGMYGPQFQYEIFDLLSYDFKDYLINNPSIYTVLQQKDSHGCSLMATTIMDLIYNNNPTYWYTLSQSDAIQTIVDRAIAIKDLHSNNAVCFQTCNSTTPYCLDGFCVECLNDSDCSTNEYCIETGFCADIDFTVSDPDGTNESSNNIGIIIGAVFGSLVGLVLVIVGVMFFYRMSQQKPGDDSISFSLL